MDPILWLAAALALTALTIPGALVFVGLKLSRTLAITVQAPTAEMPASVQATLDAINEKLTPAKLALDDEKLASYVYEAVALAETRALKGYDKFRVARDYVVTMAEKAGFEQPDARALALRIEAAVSMGKVKRQA